MNEPQPSQDASLAETVKMPDPAHLVLSSSPHIQAGDSIRVIMFKVLLCLFPAAVAAVWFFANAIFVIAYCTLACVLFEHLWCMLCKKKTTIHDLSACVTGVILALNLPASAPWWLCVVGSFMAIIVAKEIFGGLGQNPFNPAAVARVALLIGFAGPMTDWTQTRQMVSEGIRTGATPLASKTEPLYNLLVGNTMGSIGETSVIALLLGGIGLMAFHLIRWQIPLAMLGTVALITWIANLIEPGLTPSPAYHLCSGGLMIGAFFMATDMVTSPITKLGAFVFGAMIGGIVCVIRIWGAYPEGVSFAIVIMNALVPLIDRFCYKRPFGWTSTSASALQMRRGAVK